MSLEEIERLCGKKTKRKKFSLDLLKTLAEEVLESVRWEGEGAFLLLSSPTSDFEGFYNRISAGSAQDIGAKPPEALLKHSGKLVPLKLKQKFGFILAAADGNKFAFLLAQPEDQSTPMPSEENDPLYKTIFTDSPGEVERCLHALAERISNPEHKEELLSAIKTAIPAKARPDDGKPSALDDTRGADPQLRKSLTTLAWTRFGFDLEEKLGDLLEPEENLQVFSDLLKTQLHYDYLEISTLPNSFPEQGEPSNWVRNDTGFGGKLLSIILKDHYLRSLPRRRRPLVVQPEKCESIIDNPELLRVMELNRGILVPLVQGKHAYGVMMLFFQKHGNFNAELKHWLTTTGSILLRAMNRAWRYQAAQKMATIDGLTGLYNHRYFMDQLRKEFTRARRYRNWLSLILIDIDHFKDYNDNNGHLAGDRVLVKVAETIRNSVREIDLVARWGGEEFALLLPENNEKNGMFVAEKIRKEVEDQRFKNERKQPGGNLTISLGVADNSSDLKNFREMFNRADAALYRAKHLGRNRCASAK